MSCHAHRYFFFFFTFGRMKADQLSLHSFAMVSQFRQAGHIVSASCSQKRGNQFALLSACFSAAPSLLLASPSSRELQTGWSQGINVQNRIKAYRFRERLPLSGAGLSHVSRPEKGMTHLIRSKGGCSILAICVQAPKHLFGNSGLAVFVGPSCF